MFDAVDEVQLHGCSGLRRAVQLARLACKTSLPGWPSSVNLQQHDLVRDHEQLKKHASSLSTWSSVTLSFMQLKTGRRWGTLLCYSLCHSDVVQRQTASEQASTNSKSSPSFTRGQMQEQPVAQPEPDRDEASREAREARETLKKEWEEAIKKTKPKDTAAGLKSGMATAAAGVASGIVGLFAAPIVGAKQEGASGFAKGLATGKQDCRKPACQTSAHVCSCIQHGTTLPCS